MSSGAFDWAGLRAAAVDHLVSAVRQVRREHPEETVYGAMVHEFYGDGEVIYWPCVTVGTEETLAEVIDEYRKEWPEESDGDRDHSLRWSGADLRHLFEPDADQGAWAERCAEQAKRAGDLEAWLACYEQFLTTFADAAKEAGAQLLREELVDEEFIAVAIDETGDLVPLSLTVSQLRRHFPEYAAEEERDI